MTISKLLFVLAFLGIHQAASAQSLYKWVDKNGKVTYSDRPAPTDQDIKDLSANINTMGAGEAQSKNLPFELLQTINRSPVQLYAAKGCPPCDEGRQLLKLRGVPYTEKLVESEKDLKVLQEKFNVQTLPVLSIGNQSKFGFSTVEWNAALDTAAYPKESRLPKGYATGKIEPLSPPIASGATQTTPTPDAAPSISNNTLSKIREVIVPNVNIGTPTNNANIKF